MLAECKKQDMPEPQFESRNHLFSVAFLKTDPKTDPKTTTENQILAIISINGKVSINEIAVQIGKGVTVTKEYIHNLILKAMNPKKNIKQDVFRDKIHRIIFLYKLLNEGKDIVTNEICELFEISDRTLRRDIKVLRDVCDNEIYFDKDKGYYF